MTVRKVEEHCCSNKPTG